eukprot:1133552-Pelagomonas_calceolata.AAC.1
MSEGAPVRSTSYHCQVSGCTFKTSTLAWMAQHTNRWKGQCGSAPLFNRPTAARGGFPPAAEAAPVEAAPGPACGCSDEEGHPDLPDSEDDDSDDEDEDEFADELSEADLCCMRIAHYVMTEEKSNVSTNNLLQMMRDCGAQVPFKDASDVHEYLQAFVPDSSMWKTTILAIEGFPSLIPFFYIDLGMELCASSPSLCLIMSSP